MNVLKRRNKIKKSFQVYVEDAGYVGGKPITQNI